MTKKKQVLLAVAGFIVIGSGVWFGGKRAYEAVTAVKVQEKVEGICSLNNISRIEFKEDTLTTLEKQGDTWVNSEYSYLKYDQEAVNTWVNQLMQAQSAAVVKNVDNENTYGINDESPMITVFDSENKSETYRVGSVMNSEDKIYIKGDEEKFLWVVPFEEKSLFTVKPNLFVNCKDKLKLDQVTSVQFTDQKRAGYTIKEDQGTWYLEGYFAMPCVISEQAAAPWVKAMQDLQLEKYVGTFEDLAPYGLAEPQMEVTINGSIKLLLGKQKQNSVYVAFEGEKDVYTISKAVYSSLFEMNYFDGLDKRVLHLSLDAIDHIELTNPQKTFKFVVNASEPAAAPEAAAEAPAKTEMQKDGENKQDTSATAQQAQAYESETKAEETVQPSATLMEQPLSRVEAEEWLNKIEESLHMEAVLQNPEIEQKEERKAECSMTYYLKNGEVIEIELVPYDINYYILRYNGAIEVAVNKENVTKLFTSLARFNSKG